MSRICGSIIHFPICLHGVVLINHYNVKACGRVAFTSIILDFRSRWTKVVSFTPWKIYSLGNIPQYPLNRRLGGSQSLFGGCDVEKNTLPLPGIEPRPSSL
jgi:hypothetical protein